MNYWMKLFSVSAALLLLGSASAGPLQICKFKNDKKGAVSLTFDDGTRDHLVHALPLLKQYGFKGTFYIIINRVPQQVKEPRPLNGFLTWDELKLFLAEGHEIGNHSMTHRRQLTKEKSMEDVRREINDPIPVFRQKLGIDVETFCYPGCANTPEIEKIVKEHHLDASRWRYACGGPKFTLEQWKRYMEQISAKGEDAAMMIHGIVPGGGWSPFPDRAMFEACLKDLKQREQSLWVDTYANVSRYKLLRDASTIEIRSEAPREITAELKTSCTKPFRIPLTIKYHGTETISVSQNGKPVAVERKKDCTLFDVLPGEFTLRR